MVVIFFNHFKGVLHVLTMSEDTEIRLTLKTLNIFL